MVQSFSVTWSKVLEREEMPMFSMTSLSIYSHHSFFLPLSPFREDPWLQEIGNSTWPLDQAHTL